MLNEPTFSPSLLQVRSLSKTYQNRTGLFRSRAVQAVKPLSFDLEVGQTLAIVGEAGSGKSTLARILAGMIEPSSGEIHIEGQLMRHGDYQARCKLLRMIFQDPNSSLNRKIRVGQILETPLRLNTELSEEEREEKVMQTLRMVGMLADHAFFYPQMLSAGQQQRVALARALILNPKIVVADEALSTLDISVRSQIINLLLEMQETMGLSYVLVANDLGVVSHISDEVLVMHDGQVVERGKTLKVFADPQHGVTKKLIQNYNNEYRR
ncbi:cationic peptide transport system ATP-binding protein [Aeromonas sp. BIGb0405]|uniref:peptide ABC transporter ATP-binding protein n=1 Tax=Aeromonas TaxID=642 RepID=UPI001CCAE315|nr:MULTISPECIES: ATP-binding cassette domain-containing protein [Aeromonas]MCS3454105.1 cationic peptide transport system ATP-binding protein [Aeromonas sp. BIGb0405]MCS3459985.1 cationic peptide transport system ATP-binding protein [Aeromonas sp. BIGb0445]UBO75614.1 ATP-binding cassette domain-containing protein [Aeromonas rivuli]